MQLRQLFLHAVPWAWRFSWAASSGDRAESGYLGYLQPHLTHSPETRPSILGQITSSMSSDALSVVG